MKAKTSGHSRWPLFLLLLSVLGSSGCVAAGLAAAGACAAAGAGGYAYVKGRMTRDYPASMQDTAQALVTSLNELGFPLLDRGGSAGNTTFVTETTTGTKITVDLTTQGSAIPSDATVTRVGVRVGVFGDENVSDRILDQVSLHLVPGARMPRPGVAPGALQPVAAQLPIQPLPLQPVPPQVMPPQVMPPQVMPPQVMPPQGVPVIERENPSATGWTQPTPGNWRGSRP